jgi:hypothetical protein
LRALQALDPVVMKSLAKNRARRYPSAHELAVAIETYLRTASDNSGKFWGDIQRYIRRRRGDLSSFADHVVSRWSLSWLGMWTLPLILAALIGAYFLFLRIELLELVRQRMDRETAEIFWIWTGNRAARSRIEM